MRAGDVIKPIGSCLIFVVVLAGILTVTAILLKGLTWVSEILAPFLFPVFLLTLLFALILIPLALIRNSRGLAAIGYLIASNVCSAILFIDALLATWALWGMFAVVFGLLAAGVGIVPVSILAVIFNQRWLVLLDLVILIACTAGFRFLAGWLATKADQEAWNPSAQASAMTSSPEAPRPEESASPLQAQQAGERQQAAERLEDELREWYRNHPLERGGVAEDDTDKRNE